MSDTVTDEVVEVEDEQHDVEVEDPRATLELNAKYRRENKGLRDRLKAAEAELEELRKSQLSEQERAIEEARSEAAAEVEAKYRTKLLEASVRAVATGVLADPEDAWRLIDFEDTDPDDTKSISDAVAALVESKPYLAVQQQRPRQSIDQGPQGNPPTQATGDTWLRQQFNGRR